MNKQLKMSLWPAPKRIGWQLGIQSDNPRVWLDSFDRIGWKPGTKEFNQAACAAEWANLARRLIDEQKELERKGCTDEAETPNSSPDHSRQGE